MDFKLNGLTADSGHTKRPVWQCKCGGIIAKKDGMFPPTCGNCTPGQGGLRVVSTSAGK